MHKLNRSKEAIAVCDELVARYIEEPDSSLRVHVARALVNKGVMLGALGHDEEAFLVFERVVSRYGQATDSGLRKLVAEALVNRGVGLDHLRRNEQAIQVFGEVVRRYRDATDPALCELVAQAQNGIGYNKMMTAKRSWNRSEGQEEIHVLLVSALAALHEALDRAPQKAIVLGNLAYAHFLLGNQTQARLSLEDAIAIGGEETRAFALDDSEIYPIPQDQAFRELVTSIPAARSEAAGGRAIQI